MVKIIIEDEEYYFEEEEFIWMVLIVDIFIFKLFS